SKPGGLGARPNPEGAPRSPVGRSDVADPGAICSGVARSGERVIIGRRVATTGRESAASGGRAARSLLATKLVASGRTWSGPRMGWSLCTSAPLILVPCGAPRPNWSSRTATTAFRTVTLRYTLTWFTLMTVRRSTTTLFTTRGPPQPTHDGRPMNALRPHQGTSGSPQPRATQLTNGTPMLTRTPGAPKNATRAGAYTERTTRGPGAHAQNPFTNTQRP